MINPINEANKEHNVPGNNGTFPIGHTFTINFTKVSILVPFSKI